MPTGIPKFSVAPSGPPTLKTVVKSATKASKTDKKESPTVGEKLFDIGAGVQRATQPDTTNVGNAYNNVVETVSGDFNAAFGDWFSAEEEGKTTGKKNVNKGSARFVVKPKPAPQNPNFSDTSEILNQSSQTGEIKPLYTKEESAARYPTEQGQPDEKWISGEKAPFSIFNEWSLFKWRGNPRSSNPPLKQYNAAWIMGNNSSLKKETDVKSQILGNFGLNEPTGEVTDFNQFRNPSINMIIEEVNNGQGATEAYRYSYFDFAMCRYSGRISNDYMLTLRRFPMPIEDDITTAPDINGKEMSMSALPAMAQAVTWMSEVTGNKLEDILKFNVSTEWEKVKSKLQEMGGGGSGGGQVGETIKNSSVLSSIYGSATGQSALQTKAQREGWDPFADTYPNHVYGPINAIKEIAVRQQGLNFEQNMDINFHYSLKQIAGGNPRAAFLDLMANLLVLTYNNGKFWGGAVRHTGGSGGFNRPFGDSSKLASGDLGGFFKSISSGFFSGAKNFVNDIFKKDPGSLFGFKMNLGDSKFLNNFLGGQMMDMFGTPQGTQAINAFLQGNATGEWHLTIGNPLNPIAVIGNLYCESADFQFGGEMSYDGFPTELTVKVTLKHARPRDKADIESMFNGGKGRMYLMPEGGVDVGESVTVSAYGNRDKAGNFTAVKRMTNG